MHHLDKALGEGEGERVKVRVKVAAGMGKGSDSAAGLRRGIGLMHHLGNMQGGTPHCRASRHLYPDVMSPVKCHHRHHGMPPHGTPHQLSGASRWHLASWWNITSYSQVEKENLDAIEVLTPVCDMLVRVCPVRVPCINATHEPHSLHASHPSRSQPCRTALLLTLTLTCASN